jgi:hypothetical protein
MKLQIFFLFLYFTNINSFIISNNKNSKTYLFGKKKNNNNVKNVNEILYKPKSENQKN